MIYDCVIIGSGPAGMSVALNLKIHEKNFVWLGTRNMSDKVEKAEEIRNYPGLPAVSGQQLLKAFQDHMDQMGLQIKEQMCNSIIDMGDHYAVMAETDFYETKTVVMATGVANVNTLKNETAFLGRGVSYCATCDGGLYRNKTIAVLSNNRRFEHEVKYLADLAEKVYFFPFYKGSSDIKENVEKRIIGIREVQGEMRVNGLLLADGTTLPLDGLFCLRDAVAMSTLLPALQLENGHIVVNRRMETNLKGVFAAGDCTGRPYQYTKAVGEGNVAAHSIIEYLAQ